MVKNRKASLWLGTVPGFWSRLPDGHFLWECMCDISRLVVPPDFTPRQRKRSLREMEDTMREDACPCAIDANELVRR